MPIRFHQATLPNGLTIIAETDDAAHSAAAGFFVKTGARDEASPVMGVSHFLEHMMFKGTDRRTAEQINQEFDRIGARNNAYTSHEMTCFHATVLPEFLLGDGGAIDILSDMMRPALRQQDFDTEKKVILEEIAMYEDNPFWVLYEKAVERHYGRHPLSHRVLGTAATVSDLTSGQMREYFASRYSADNTVVALAGRVDFDRAVSEIGARCLAWGRTDASRVPGGPPIVDQEFTERSSKVNRAYLLAMWPGPGAADDRRYAASLAAQVLGGPDNSRLHWSLIETGLADDAEASFDPRDGTGDTLVFVTCDPDRAEEVWAVVDRQITELSKSLEEDDLAKIRAKIATAATLAGERPGGRMQRLGRQWTTLGRYLTLEDEVERINRVAVDDVRAVLSDFPARPRTFGRLLPA